MIRKCRVVVCQSNPTAFLPSSLLTMAINADLCSVIGQATFYIGVRRRCHVFAKSPRCYVVQTAAYGYSLEGSYNLRSAFNLKDGLMSRYLSLQRDTVEGNVACNGTISHYICHILFYKYFLPTDSTRPRSFIPFLLYLCLFPPTRECFRPSTGLASTHIALVLSCLHQQACYLQHGCCYCCWNVYSGKRPKL